MHSRAYWCGLSASICPHILLWMCLLDMKTDSSRFSSTILTTIYHPKKKKLLSPLPKLCVGPDEICIFYPISVFLFLFMLILPLDSGCSVFLLYHMGFRLKTVFARSYMFPINIMLTEFAIQSFTRRIVVVGNLYGSVLQG